MQTQHPIARGVAHSPALFIETAATSPLPLRPLASGMAPGTCGEFIQGALGGQDFLVNCPVNLFSHADVYESSEPGLHVQDGVGFAKIAAIADALEARFGISLHHEIHVLSDIPRGKGMASSSADLSAALHGLCGGAGLHVSPQMFATILTMIEPSDCVHFHGIAHVNQLTGQLFDLLPAPRGMRAIVVDCGGEVDTVTFDRERAHGVYAGSEGALAEALALLKKGLRTGTSADIARAATMSAQISQQILFKPQFAGLLAVAEQHGALGVNCAHSGTVLGVLYEAAGGRGAALAGAIADEFGGDAKVLGDFQIISGGCYGKQ